MSGSKTKKTARTQSSQIPQMRGSWRAQPASWRTLLESWSSEFSARCDRVRHLIGDSHWLSDGSHKEALVRTFLADRLPDRVAVEQGFILSPRKAKASSQIDILVRDTQHSAPFFKESGITVCDPKAALAIIELKSSFTASNLSEALASLSQIRAVMHDSRSSAHAWVGLWFAMCPQSRTDESVLRTIISKIAPLVNTASNGVLGNSAPIPTCIACAGKFCCFLSNDAACGGAKVRYFPIGSLSFSVAVIDLLSHVYSSLGSEGFQPLEEGLEQIMDVSPVVRMIGR